MRFVSLIQKYLPLIGRFFDSSYSIIVTGRFAILASGLISSILLARGLGVVGRGEIAAIMLWPSLLVYLGGLGLSESTLYFGTQKIYDFNEIHTAIILFVSCLSIVVIPLGFWIIPFTLYNQSSDIIQLSQLFLLFVPFGMLLGHYASFFRSQLRMREFNTLTLIFPLGSVVIVLLLIAFNQLTLKTAILSYILLSILGVCYSWFIIITNRFITHIRINFALCLDMISYGLKVHIGTVLSLANVRLDQILLVSFVTPMQLGLYVVAVKVAAISSFLTPIIIAIEIPKIATMEDIQHRAERLWHVFRHFWFVSASLKILFLLATPIMLPLLYGSDFQAAVLPCVILVISSLFLDATQVLTGGVQALNSPWIGSKAEIAAALFTIVGLILTIPILGILGASFVSLGAYIVAFCVIVSALTQKFKLPIRSMFTIRSSSKT